MLSIAKINSADNQRRCKGDKGYTHYLGSRSTRQKTDFDDYARGGNAQEGPAPFWACNGPALLGLDDIAEAEQVERLANGFHPLTGAPLVKGAGQGHVQGLDMTFSAPKDFSAVFAGSDEATREALIECLQLSARAALGYAETAAITRHGHAGKIKQVAEAAIAACYTHFASRALDPQLHVHAFMFNVGKRKDSEEWSALEHRPQFDRKMATGILFRVELASRLRGLGFAVEPAGPFFTIGGIGEEQRAALSTRSREIAEYLQDTGMLEADGPAAREVAALNSRAGKAEPPLPELLRRFQAMASELGITPSSVAAMRGSQKPELAPLSIDHGALLERLMESQSCATAQEALALICEQAMGRWNAKECLAELERFLAHEHVVQLGRTELLTTVFTSKATKDLEAAISQRVNDGALDATHRVAKKLVDREFDRLESELRAKLGVEVSLVQQRQAAHHIATEPGRCAFVEGWAGTGKTTMLKAAGLAYKAAGLQVIGCCQSAAASQNLARETGIPSRTIASLLLAIQEKRVALGSKSVLILDEAGMVGSHEFSALQGAVWAAGGKLVAVGDPKQLQPIDAGGIFGSLMRLHGKSEISNIQRQRTDFEPLLKWLDGKSRRGEGLSPDKAQALRELPEDARMAALEKLCEQDAKLAKAFARWRNRFDFEWMREAVEAFATGSAKEALGLLEAKGRLKLVSGQKAACELLISAWDKDKTPIEKKTIVAATRAEVAELNLLARAKMVERGAVSDSQGIEAEIIHRDDTRATKRFAPGDRIVLTLNDRTLGVANGVSGTILSIEQPGGQRLFKVALDDANERDEKVVMVPASFGRFDHAYCLTNHKSQGRTFDSAYVLANPAMADREWTYVAASRSRFATTIFVNASALGLIDPESHRGSNAPKTRAAAIDALASRMRRSRAKGTSLDYDDAPDISQVKEPDMPERSSEMGAVAAATRAAATVSSMAIERARALLSPLIARAAAGKARGSDGHRAR